MIYRKRGILKSFHVLCFQQISDINFRYVMSWSACQFQLPCFIFHTTLLYKLEVAAHDIEIGWYKIIAKIYLEISQI